MNSTAPFLDPAPARPLHILVVGGQSDSLTILRGDLIQAMRARGHRVTAAAGQPVPHVMETLEGWGVGFHEVPMDRAGLNPIRDLGTIGALAGLMRRLKPDVVLAYQAKPLNYAMIAAALAGAPRRVGLVTGLGYAFTEGGEWRRKATGLIVRNLYRLALRYAHGVVFQNEDDRELFKKNRILRPHARTMRANGSGVDLSRFRPAPFVEGPPRFLMIARLLKDKGVYEYVEAARRVKAKAPAATFALAGPFDPNPAAIRPEEVRAWVEEGVLIYLGPLQDVREAIADAHVVVLPSYREGVPKTLLEAMAMGRPIVATDVPGCRDAVADAENGLLVPARDAEGLASAMLRMARDRDLREHYGRDGRKRAERLFDVQAVSNGVMRFIEEL